MVSSDQPVEQLELKWGGAVKDERGEMHSTELYATLSMDAVLAYVLRQRLATKSRK